MKKIIGFIGDVVILAIATYYVPNFLLPVYIIALLMSIYQNAEFEFEFKFLRGKNAESESKELQN